MCPMQRCCNVRKIPALARIINRSFNRSCRERERGEQRFYWPTDFHRSPPPTTVLFSMMPHEHRYIHPLVHDYKEDRCWPRLERIAKRARFGEHESGWWKRGSRDRGSDCQLTETESPSRILLIVERNAHWSIERIWSMRVNFVQK